MTTTQILMFHPNPAGSKANAALAAAAEAVPGVTVADMTALYPGGEIDADREVARLIACDRFVLQFPVQWYATPPLLKAWQDVVLTRMFYVAYATEGARLQGKPVLVAATAGNTPAAYSAEGQNLFALEELLRPLEATAHRCGLAWSRPFLLYGANKLADAALYDAASHYADRLRCWTTA